MEPGISKKLKLLVFGATGRTGRHVMEMALEAGHHVTAVVRDALALSKKHERLQVIQGDILQPETYRLAMFGKDAVLSAIGSSKRVPDTLSQGTANLLEIMQETGVNRMMCISAIPVEIGPEIALWQKLITKYVLQKLLRHVYEDTRQMEQLLRRSSMDWTVVRPPMLKNNPASGKYRTVVNSFLARPVSIGRADLAHYMINSIDDPDTYRSVVEIAY